MKKRTKLIVGFGCLLPVLLFGALVLAVIVGPPGPHFTCHRGLDAAFTLWQQTAKVKNWYPNVQGDSTKSLELVAPYIRNGMTDLRDYRYIPGLKLDDPEELILMYLKEPSWRTWHGDTHWIRSNKRWVILNPRMSFPDETYGRGWSEAGEAIETPDFKRRLQATLDFLKENNRPDWTNVVQEHGAFLKRIKE